MAIPCTTNEMLYPHYYGMRERRRLEAHRYVLEDEHVWCCDPIHPRPVGVCVRACVALIMNEEESVFGPAIFFQGSCYVNSVTIEAEILLSRPYGNSLDRNG